MPGSSERPRFVAKRRRIPPTSLRPAHRPAPRIVLPIRLATNRQAPATRRCPGWFFCRCGGPFGENREIAARAGLYLLVFVNYAVVWAVVITDRFLEGRGFGSHAKIVHLTIANPVSAQDLDVILPPSFSKFERVHVDKEAHQVSVTAQVRLKPTAVAGLMEALRANEKIRKFEIE